MREYSPPEYPKTEFHCVAVVFMLIKPGLGFNAQFQGNFILIP